MTKIQLIWALFALTIGLFIYAVRMNKNSRI